LDLNVLAALRDRNKFRQLRGAVPDSLLGQETVAMLQWYGSYFNAFPDKDYVETDVLRSLFTLKVGSTATPEQLAVMRSLMNKLDEPVDSEVIDGITTMLYERDFAGRAAALLNTYDNGGEVDITYELCRMSSENMRRISASAPSSYIDTPIEDILADFGEDRGLKFPTAALQSTIAGLQGGDSIAIAGRPDKGKTSFIAAATTGFAKQLRSLGLDGRPILWLNNEGSGKRIIPRIYQAALNITFEEMVAQSNAGTLRAAYQAAMDGQTIRVKDCHGMTLGQLEQIIEEMNPCVVVFDMLGNFRMPNTGGGNKTDALEQMWQEAREMAVRHDFVAMPTIQISADGDNMLFPPYSALKDSKTGVQGACDVILMMGALNSIDMDTVRGFSTPKNKRQMPGKPSNAQNTVFFDAPTCQFLDGDV
jgi:hypothetical protein